jgi:type IX secretion system PorP/SprF family membrane protein
MKKFILLSVLFCCISFGAKSQDASFLNNNQSLLLVNPSFAGSNGNWRFQSNYGNVKPNYSSGQILYYLGMDACIKPTKGAFALSYLGNNFYRGVLKDQRLSLAYAQHFTIGEKKIKFIPSIELTYIQLSLDINALTFGHPFWSSNHSIFPASNKRNLDFSTGLLLNYKNLCGGVSIKHITQPDIGFTGPSKLPASINIHASYTKTLNEKSFIQFFTLYNHQATINTIALNTNAVLMKHLVIGLGLCSNAKTSMSLGYRNNTILSVFSFGKDFSKLAGALNYQANLSLAFSLKKKSQRNWIGNFENW